MSRKLVTDDLGLVAKIDPDAATAAAYTSDWAAVKDFATMAAMISVGDLGTSATVDAKLQQATDSSGTGAKDITGKAITQLTQAGTDDSNKIAWINFKEDDLDTANQFTHVAIVMTVGTATSDAAAFLFGSPPTYGPASDRDLAAVVEIVA